MKQLTISGTLVVSDAVFEMLQEQGMIAGEDLTGVARSTNAIMFLLHDALEEWHRLKKTGVLDSTIELSRELSQLNSTLRLLSRFDSGNQNGAESLAQVSDRNADETVSVVEEPASEPQEEKPEAKVSAPPSLSRDQICARLSGFMAKGGA